jgi:glycerophosphoryl diester phosphodiesterase
MLIDKSKFLSHRLRGFDKNEQTLKSIKKATACDIPYLEIDIRISKDGIFYVYHDSSYKYAINRL